MTFRKSLYLGRFRWSGVWLLLFWTCAFPRLASAQCAAKTPLGFQNISPEPGNPFQAEYSMSVTSPSTSAPAPLGAVLRSAARDSHGRVRVEHSRGSYQIQHPDGTTSTEERAAIFICDPSTGMSIHLDTLNKTATVRNSRDLPTPTAPASGAQSFCARMFEIRTRNSDAQTKDLGHRLVAGFDTRGLRFWSPLRPDFDVSPSFTYTDTWCSDELAAVVSLVVVSANGDHRRETMLKKVMRKEPDPVLFQIPAGYTRIERETPPRSNPALN